MEITASAAARRALPVAVVLVSLAIVAQYVAFYFERPYFLFTDARLYFDATSLWLGGGDPWSATNNGIAFAGIPPTLLLNLPLQPFGAPFATLFWAITGIVAWVAVIVRLRLAWWWWAFPPFWGAYLAGSSDSVLLAAMFGGAGSLAALTKPYSVPAMLAVGRWRAVLLGTGAGLLTLPLLPWGLFLGQLNHITRILEAQALSTSAWGEWPLALAAVVAAASLGKKRALALMVPLLWPSAQPHYALSSVPALRASAALALALSVPGAIAPGVILYALTIHLRSWRRGTSTQRHARGSVPVRRGRRDSVEWAHRSIRRLVRKSWHGRYRRPMRAWGKTIAVGLGLGLAVVALVTWTQMRGTPVDAWCYYGMDPANPYDTAGCFLYSPPVAQFMTAIQPLVSFDAFFTILRTLEILALALITGPAIGVLLVIPAVAIELNAANINILLVGAVLLGFRYPWTWAFVVLTKLTPGVGLLWFAVRREWRSFAIAAGVTVAIATLSFALAPWMWRDYLGALGGAPDETPFKIWWRLPIAALVVIWGARSNHRWAMIVAVFLAMPRWYFLSPVILVGLFPLVRLPRPLPMPRLSIQWPMRPARASQPLPSAGKTATSIGSAVS